MSLARPHSIGRQRTADLVRGEDTATLSYTKHSSTRAPALQSRHPVPRPAVAAGVT